MKTHTTTLKATYVALLAALWFGCCCAAPTPGSYVSFISCPLLRDTPDVPCWMARDGQTLYFLGIQQGRNFASTWYQPQLKHRVLVEGIVSHQSPVCGGIPLEDMHVSDQPEISLECNTLLPNEGYVSPHGRPAGPDPARKPGELIIVRDPPVGAPILYTQEDVDAKRPLQFDIFYNFNSDFLIYPQQQNRVVQAQAYAKAIGAHQIVMTAHRGAALLSNGTILNESSSIAARRAAKLTTVLTSGFDIASASISTKVLSKPDRAKGQGDWTNRHVTLDVVP